jgi:hypothetical protein
MLMVDNCPKCGKVYQKNLRNMCQECLRQVDDSFQICYSYLKTKRKATTEELCRDTRVNEQQVMMFIKDNRLPLLDYPNLTYACTVCGARIRKHTMCVKCSMNLTSEINDMWQKENKLKGSGYHSIRRESR